MEHLQVAVCDDSIEEQKQLLTMIQETNKHVKVRVFNDGEALLKNYIPSQYDLIFMDIYMTGMTGIDTVTAIR